MSIHFVSDWSLCYNYTLNLLLDDGPSFLSRIGGSDTFVIAEYLATKTKPCPDYQEVLKWASLVERYNGYYDLKNSDENFLSYCETMLRSYYDCSKLIFCNHQLLALYFRDNIHPKIANQPIQNREALSSLISSLEQNADREARDIHCFPYPYVERLVQNSWTLFSAFSVVLPGKKVLVVSPFAKSIKANFPNRQKFFKNYDYPEFLISLYNTPVTYAGLPDEFYPHENWHQTLEHMKLDISELDFDIALLACGSYALPLGLYIEKVMEKKAVYVGGVLQMYFGILGRRYDNPFFTDQTNRESFIWPLEREDFATQIKNSEHTAHEAFGAYF